jgi:porphobilinogen synthase
MVAPSGMMDGAVAAMRDALDHDGFTNTGILAYAVKYASALYGPFRDAAGSALKFGDRRTHQMDPANAREALREAALDAQEGADMLMVKPALFYLDVIHRLREQFASLPIAAYNVSGEYSMVKAAAAQGWVDERAAALEMLTAIRRAGADIVITYWALDAAGWL